MITLIHVIIISPKLPKFDTPMQERGLYLSVYLQSSCNTSQQTVIEYLRARCLFFAPAT